MEFLAEAQVIAWQAAARDCSHPYHTHLGVPAGPSFTPQGMTLRDGTFALFLSGQYNTATKEAFVAIQKQGGCASFVSFHNMTHFGMNDSVAPLNERHQAKLPTPLLPSFQSIGIARNTEIEYTHTFCPCLVSTVSEASCCQGFV